MGVRNVLATPQPRPPAAPTARGRWIAITVGALAVSGLAAGVWAAERSQPLAWTEPELATLKTLALGRLPAPPVDPSNRVADDPRAAALGAALFRDVELSRDRAKSCASCHDAAHAFSRPRQGTPAPTPSASHSERLLELSKADVRDTPSLAGLAFADFVFWDGRRDSLWAQALVPLEAPLELGLPRVTVVRRVLGKYAAPYRDLFGAPPAVEDARRFPPEATPLGTDEQRVSWAGMSRDDQVEVNRAFANLGKAIAAYERQLRFRPSALDGYLAALGKGEPREAARQLSASAERGLQLFVGKARCSDCHRGPLLTSNEFFSIGLPLKHAGVVDWGRADAIPHVGKDPFNCRGLYSDSADGQCQKLDFMAVDLDAALSTFRVPSLRNVALTAPYMHAGQLATLEEVVDFYDRAQAPKGVPTHIKPLGLTVDEKRALVDFLKTLDSSIEDPLEQPVGKQN